MKTSTKPKNYKLSFIINSVIGGLMLALSIVGYVIEIIHPQLRGTLAGGFLFTAIICLFIASLHYSKYLASSNQ